MSNQEQPTLLFSSGDLILQTLLARESIDLGKRYPHYFYTPPDGGSLHTSGHEMNLRANMAQKRSVLNATPANEIGMAGELRIGDWR